MKTLRIIISVLGMLTLTHCGQMGALENEVVQDIKKSSVECGDNCINQGANSTKLFNYNGTIREQFNQGQEIEFAHRKIDLTLNLNKKEEVEAKLIYNQCAYKGHIKSQDFINLVRLSKSSGNNHCIGMDCQGQMGSSLLGQLTLTTVAGKKNTRHSQSLSHQDGEKLHDEITKVVRSLNVLFAEGMACPKIYKGNVEKLILKRNVKNDEKDLNLRWAIQLTSKGYYISGEKNVKKLGEKEGEVSKCSQKLVDVPLPDSIAKKMQTVKIKKMEKVCKMAENPNNQTKLTLKQKGKKEKTGILGCQYEDQVKDSEEFRKALRLWLRDQQRVCK